MFIFFFKFNNDIRYKIHFFIKSHIINISTQ